MRFHLLGLSHLPTSRKYLACAFTQKNVKLARMLTSLGHEVIVYGCHATDGPLPVCTEFVETHTERDIRQTWGSGDNRFTVGYDWQSEPFRHDFNDPATECTAKFRDSCIREIKARKRPDDFLLVTQGTWHKPIADAVKLFLTCEPGIGYRGSWCRWRAFESAYIQNFTYGSEHPRQSIDGSYYDRVIPNYFEEEDAAFAAKPADPPYFLYVGRLIERKGIRTAALACQHLGTRLVIAGQGGRVDSDGTLHGEDFRLPKGTWEYVGYADLETRRRLMAGAGAFFCPTLYLEPFAGTHVEAMLSGTPVITTNFGVFPETVRDGINGFRCNTLNDFVRAAKAVPYLDRAKVRTSAERFLCDNVRHEFDRWFRDLYDVYESATDANVKGWHRIREAG